MAQNRLQIQIAAQDAASGVLASVNSKLDKLGKTAKDSTGAFTALTGAVTGLAAAFSARDVYEANKEYQSLAAGLQSVLHSADAAAGGMEALRKFAQETPYELNETVEAFIALKARGLDPSMEALKAYGNIAAAMPGKSIRDFTEAVADAVTGEFERLKEFGIKASKDGEKVSFTFAGVTKTIGNNAKEIEAYLRDLSNTNFGDAMALRAKTLEGVFSNVKDAVSQFYTKIGDGGLNDALIRLGTSFSDNVKNADDLAAALGQRLGKAVDALSAGMVYATQHTEELKAGLVALAATGAVRAIGAIASAVAALAAPVTLVVGAVAAAAGALYYFRDASVSATDPNIKLRDVLTGLASWIMGGFKTAMDTGIVLFTSFADTVSDLSNTKAWQAISSVASATFEGIIWLVNRTISGFHLMGLALYDLVTGDFANFEAEARRIANKDYFADMGASMAASIKKASQERIAAEEEAARQEAAAKQKREEDKQRQEKAFQDALAKAKEDAEKAANAPKVDKKAEEEAKRRAEEVKKRIAELKAENDQQERLIAAYGRGKDAVSVLQQEIAGENAVRQAGIDLKSREGQEIYALAAAHEALGQSVSEAQKKMQDGETYNAKVESLTKDIELQKQLTEAYAKGPIEVERLTRAMEIERMVREEVGEATGEQARRIEELVRAREKEVDAGREVQRQYEENMRVGKEYADVMIDGFTRMITEGRSFGDTLRDIIKEMGNMAVKKAMTGLFDAAGNYMMGGTTTQTGGNGGAAGGGFSSLIGSVIGWAIGGARAVGGPVASGVPYVVGEYGREVFVPSEPGSIVPNHKLGSLGGGAPQINNHFHFHTPDAKTFMESRSQWAGKVSDAVAQGARNR